MAYAVDWLFAIGCPSVVLYTGSGTRAERFYGRLGWVREVEEGGDVGFRLNAQTVRKRPNTVVLGVHLGSW